MGAGVLTNGMRVAGVLVGVDAWVKTFVAKRHGLSLVMLTNQMLSQIGFFTISCSISAKMRAWPSLDLKRPLLFSLSLWNRWMTLLLRWCAGMELGVGMM